MSKHAPGPIQNCEPSRCYPDSPCDYCKRMNESAPELLEALKSARDTIEWILGCTEPSRDEIEKAIKEADTVIAEAEGRA